MGFEERWYAYFQFSTSRTVYKRRFSGLPLSFFMKNIKMLLFCQVNGVLQTEQRIFVGFCSDNFVQVEYELCDDIIWIDI